MGIQLLAGASALADIKHNGLSAKRIKLMVGASGGPKWLMLSRLDQYISEHFLPQADQTIDLLGSSIGAWRMALYAQSQPLASFKEFEQLYMHQRYSDKMTPQEITAFVDVVLGQLFSDARSEQVVANTKRILHVVAVRNRKFFNGSSKLLQGLGLLTAASSNVISPKLVEALYPRVIIGPQHSYQPYFKKPETIALQAGNLKQALVASGAIPMVLEPTKINGGKDRWHWDGGMVDYHFSGPFNVDDGLVFYPHFFPKITPGWFDKGLPWRKARAQDYANVVMLAPSKEFIAKLPYGKIPDRKDFLKLTDIERETYWQTVLQATDQLVDEFHEMLMKDGARSAVKPIELIL